MKSSKHGERPRLPNRSVGRYSGISTGPLTCNTARFSTLCSSLTLPGHE